jgi:hypothetical protein
MRVGRIVGSSKKLFALALSGHHWTNLRKFPLPWALSSWNYALFYTGIYQALPTELLQEQLLFLQQPESLFLLLPHENSKIDYKRIILIVQFIAFIVLSAADDGRSARNMSSILK